MMVAVLKHIGTTALLREMLKIFIVFKFCLPWQSDRASLEWQKSSDQMSCFLVSFCFFDGQDMLDLAVAVLDFK